MFLAAFETLAACQAEMNWAAASRFPGQRHRPAAGLQHSEPSGSQHWSESDSPFPEDGGDPQRAANQLSAMGEPGTSSEQPFSRLQFPLRQRKRVERLEKNRNVSVGKQEYR